MCCLEVWADLSRGADIDVDEVVEGEGDEVEARYLRAKHGGQGEGVDGGGLGLLVCAIEGGLRPCVEGE